MVPTIAEDQLGEIVEEERSFKLESVYVGGFNLCTNNKRTAWNKEKQRLTTMQWLVKNAAATLSYVIFAVNSSFLAARFSLVDGGAKIISDKPPIDGEVIGIDGCNELEDAYAFKETLNLHIKIKEYVSDVADHSSNYSKMYKNLKLLLYKNLKALVDNLGAGLLAKLESRLVVVFYGIVKKDYSKYSSY
ncbi:hypothetical protein ZIOFF_007705 [Zingiber officinale]|uniref:Uncharacterized protein n=1 Tax=Zingiber officinale TaxID=94328 RepID=A0A8J5HR97_ZINOF|nr:hypothetical protein ZIOFF_007705 [Zingiber officinale]